MVGYSGRRKEFGEMGLVDAMLVSIGARPSLPRTAESSLDESDLTSIRTKRGYSPGLM